MSHPTEEAEVRPPRAREIMLSLLLLLLFAPVVLAVGSAVFRPDWLLLKFAGVPLSVIWILVSILTFIGLTWLFAAAILSPAEEEAGQ